MGNLYRAQMSDGTSYDVETHKHHDDHTDAGFKSHLLDVIKQSISQIIGGVVVGFVHRGRR